MNCKKLNSIYEAPWIVSEGWCVVGRKYAEEKLAGRLALQEADLTMPGAFYGGYRFVVGFPVLLHLASIVWTCTSVTCLH